MSDDENDLFNDQDPLAQDARTISQMKRSRIDLGRRYVFLDPTSLGKHFEVVPLQVRDTALLVFRCGRNFVFKDPPSVRKQRLQPRVDCGHRAKKDLPTQAPSLNASLYRSEFSEEFLQWVLTKEKEGCVFWYKPDKDLVKMSQFFEEKVDPMDEQPYRPLLLDGMWWRIRFDRTSARYIGNPRSILSAIAECRGNLLPEERNIELPALQELIFQSNPTLEPIVKWPHAPSMRFLPQKVADETEYKGYILNATARRGGVHEPALHRISKWPDRPKNRKDNLHHHWQVEDAARSRRSVFALSGAMTAR
eukprot:TRINITY_DN50356_c0_g1_i1.p1 TRINITY_DN50356_c0_g1~~TRINITY_DN50356_c0_g1_i1.p1  ORF type:complete len:323 (-),score=50.63 TRINITY_DN50356_c0_g1_i1:32-952(-)